MNKLLALVLVLGTAMAFAPKAGAAEAECPSCGLLNGKYNVNVNGAAVVGAATYGTCSQAGSLAAAFTSGQLQFDGHGNISRVGQDGVLSIGATSCTFFGIVGGSYSVEDRGDGTFEATGVMNFESENPYAPCANSGDNLFLGSQPFVMTGRIGGKQAHITTYGADTTANYAEGNGGSGITCKAPILNFITSGTAQKY